MRHYDVIVVGGGHAGCEAAHASAKIGCQTLLLTMNVDTIGLMPCNPSIGGPAKGQIVGEIDALGGLMGQAADATFIQMRILNRSKGPAVQCLRTQNDKSHYQQWMKEKILSTPNLLVKQGVVQDLIIEGDKISGIVTTLNQTILARTVVITTGTFLKGRIHIGLINEAAGRAGEAPSQSLSQSLLTAGFKMGRLKTGTTPRLDARTIDFSGLEIQPGDPEWLHFSFKTPPNDRYLHQLPCHITSTNLATHTLICDNLDRSPLFQKVIKGLGPRYCPSIEDKIFRFRDKSGHQIFLEPEGNNTPEIYPQGLNTSMPEDVQEAFLRTIPGLESVEIIKPGYAVEYDFVFPEQLTHTLASTLIPNLFFAGQINGTSGYEEAAGQGIIAGINAALLAQNRPALIIRREISYIGTMIDDLITKSIHEPYRMLTSRSEYRLSLRQDNATSRLSEVAYQVGMLTEPEITVIRDNINTIQSLVSSWKKTPANEALRLVLNVTQKTPIYPLIKRPELTISTLIAAKVVDPSMRENANKAITEIKYAGYLDKQAREITKISDFENRHISDTINYSTILGLRTESREKLIKHRPKTFFEARRIPGVNPADLVVLMAYLDRRR